MDEKDQFLRDTMDRPIKKRRKSKKNEPIKNIVVGKAADENSFSASAFVQQSRNSAPKNIENLTEDEKITIYTQKVVQELENIFDKQQEVKTKELFKKCQIPHNFHSKVKQNLQDHDKVAYNEFEDKFSFKPSCQFSDRRGLEEYLKINKVVSKKELEESHYPGLKTDLEDLESIDKIDKFQNNEKGITIFWHDENYMQYRLSDDMQETFNEIHDEHHMNFNPGETNSILKDEYSLIPMEVLEVEELKDNIEKKKKESKKSREFEAKHREKQEKIEERERSLPVKQKSEESD